MGSGRGALDETIGSDRLISLTRTDEGRRYFSLDGLRSVVNLTDDEALAVASYHLDAWGNFRFPLELNDSKNRFAFTGHIWDQETGLYNAKARYFDPKLGRFLTQDSFLGQIDEPPSLHRYLYANDNPTRYVDPRGHFFIENLIGQQLEKANFNLVGGYSGYSAGGRTSLRRQLRGPVCRRAACSCRPRWLRASRTSSRLGDRTTGGPTTLSPGRPLREDQRRALDAASNPNLSPLDRGQKQQTAMLSTPAVVIEEASWRPCRGGLSRPRLWAFTSPKRRTPTTRSRRRSTTPRRLERGADAFVALGGVATGGQGLVQAGLKAP